MRKTLLVVISLLLIASQCFAWGGSGTSGTSQSSRFKTHIITNSTGSNAQNGVATTIIIPNTSVILGYEVAKLDTTLASSCFATLYDGGVTSSDEVLGEAERDTTGDGVRWFPRARVLDKQLYVIQGSNTIVIVYFE